MQPAPAPDDAAEAAKPKAAAGDESSGDVDQEAVVAIPADVQALYKKAKWGGM